MRFSKKGQLFLLSSYLILFSIFFIYSLETENTYIVNSAKTGILNNVLYETCKVGKMSNGSYIDSRYSTFVSDVSSYCSNQGYNCTLSIVKQGGAPTNLSNLNYTYYNYSLYYNNSGFIYSQNFTC